MALFTDLIDPATLTGYVRAALTDFESRRGNLARWLPNRLVSSINVRFTKGARGLVETAKFRAYDAEIEIGKRQGGQRVTIELPAIGQNIPVSEYEQLRAQGGTVPDELALLSIQGVGRQVAQAVSDGMERLRGTVLVTGKATVVGQDNFVVEDDFGRDPALTFTAPALWSVAGTDRLTQLQTWYDLYVTKNGEPPGAMLMSTRAFRALASGTQFQTQLLNGGARNATSQQVRDEISGAGLPPIELYDRRVNVAGVSTQAIADDRVLFLPAPVDPNDDQGTQLGGTWWGRTLTSTDPAWNIAPEDQPGIVTGVFKGEKPPMQLEVISDAIGEPVLANGDLSLCAKVL
jgi:hypothetical protein